MKDNRIKYRQRGHSGRKDRVNFSRRRYERNTELIVGARRILKLAELIDGTQYL